MANWLVASDIHGDEHMWDRMLKAVRDNRNIDAIILCGDLTNNGIHRSREVRVAQAMMSVISGFAPVYYILGNHDLCLTPEYFESSEVRCLEGCTHIINGLQVYGVTDTPCFDRPELSKCWHRMNPSYEHDEALWKGVPAVDVIVSHGPPFQCLDWCGSAVGSLGLRDYIQRVQPRLVLTGHIHEQSGGIDRIGTTIVRNLALTWEIVSI